MMQAESHSVMCQYVHAGKRDVMIQNERGSRQAAVTHALASCGQQIWQAGKRRQAQTQKQHKKSR